MIRLTNKYKIPKFISILKNGFSHYDINKKKPIAKDFLKMKNSGKKISMITAYDFSSAMHADGAQIDIILVGDSLGMVIQGNDNTKSVTLDNMIDHCKSVRRGAPNSFVVADLPFGTYEYSPEFALKSCHRLVKEANVDAVKLEGGKIRFETVSYLVNNGISVMGHVGLTPQMESTLGGFVAQGKTKSSAVGIFQDAIGLEKAGVFAIVVECIPSNVSQMIQSKVKVPIIGIGAGPKTDGQVLVYHDLLNIMFHPNKSTRVPSFCKVYSNIGEQIYNSLASFKTEVQNGSFPDQSYSPFKMNKNQDQEFREYFSSNTFNENTNHNA